MLSNVKETDDQQKVVATNRKAYHEYFIEEKFEAGIVLKGTEVKSLRDSRVNLQDSYASVNDGEVFLHHCHISPYSHGNIMNHPVYWKKRIAVFPILALFTRATHGFAGCNRAPQPRIAIIRLSIRTKPGLTYCSQHLRLSF